MSTHEILGWVADSAVFGFAILAIGALAVRWRKQPAERLRLIEWTLVACLIAPLLHALPGVPRWSLGIATAEVQQPDAGAAKPAAPDRTGAHEPQAIERNSQNSIERDQPTTDLPGV